MIRTVPSKCRRLPYEKLPPAKRQELNTLGLGEREIWSDLDEMWLADRAGVMGCEAGFIYRKKPAPQVLIHVRGGVAYLIRKTKGVEVTIRDFDNEDHQ